MYIIVKRDLIQHLQTLEHHFLCLDLSITHWNDIQMRQLQSLSRSIECLRFIVESFTSSQQPLAAIVEDDICNQIMTIADIAQLLLHRCADHLNEDSKGHLQAFIVDLQTVHNDLHVSASI